MSMHIVMFYHSLLSDWNHGNAHFLRGVVSELLARGHNVRVYEPYNAWSVENLIQERGSIPVDEFDEVYPGLRQVSVRYNVETLDLDTALAAADLVIVHEWNDHALVARIGEHRSQHTGYRLLFHDTHHRAVTDPQSISAYDLSHYDGVLAFGKVLRDLYLKNGWAAQAWIWHEAADTPVFHPISAEKTGDLVWVGNWGDDERTTELYEFLLGPVHRLGLKTRIYGVRYPQEAQNALREAGIEYTGWLPNYRAPEVFAHYRVTVHVPRRPYVQALPGIPTIRVFEALACGIPLVSAPWDDAEGLFTPGEDFLMAKDGAEMERILRTLMHEPVMGLQLAAHGLQTILARHTCAHRVDELMQICREIGIPELEVANSSLQQMGISA
jgi:spore maturation protein CgeB